MKANDFQEWLKTTPEYQTLVFQHGERLFIQRDGEFENLTVRLAYRAWGKQQVNIDQLNNMEQCYIQLKQEHNELIAFNTVQDRMQKSAEKVAEKYKRKVSMIADLLRDSADKDMTLKAIQTVIEREVNMCKFCGRLTGGLVCGYCGWVPSRVMYALRGDGD